MVKNVETIDAVFDAFKIIVLVIIGYIIIKVLLSLI